MGVMLKVPLGDHDCRSCGLPWEAAFRLIRAVREPMVIAFATSSSEAALPKLIEGLTKFGVDKSTTEFVLPLGYSFNVDGSMCT